MCCEHCPTLTPEEREERAYWASRNAIAGRRRLTDKSIAEAVRATRPIITTTVSVTARSVVLPPAPPNPYSPR